MQNRFGQVCLGGVLLLWAGWLLFQEIDLSTADLGRHLMNGQILVQGSANERWELLTTNFYSFTLPDAPFVNHHWLSGVIFFYVEKLSGFTGLSFFYVLLYLGALGLYFNLARARANFLVASLLAFLLLPLMAGRDEVRPEVWSYFLSGLFFNLLYFRRFLWALPLLMALWVNLHIGFIFGFLILLGFIAQEIWESRLPGAARGNPALWLVGLVTLLGSLVNPWGYKLLLYPLNIFKNYGYLIVENQSVSFLENLGLGAGMNFDLFKLVALLTLLVLISRFWFGRRPEWSLALPTLATLPLAYLGIRHFPSFAFFALVFLADSAWQLRNLFSRQVGNALLGGLLAGAFIFSLQSWIPGPGRGWGLAEGVEAGAQFFINEKLSGPIFNNYDVGSYLIYYLGKDEKVFVDNRPEAYSEEFFAKQYIAPQEDEASWRALDAQYHFGTIFFSYRDFTPWAQEFLIARVDDPAWVPVFVDRYNLIFVRNEPANARVIEKYRIPRDSFGVVRN